MIPPNEKRKAAEEHLKKSNERLARIGRHLLSGDGKEMMDELVDLFYKGSMLGETPEKTYFKLGEREVVDFLLGLQEKAKES